MRPVTLALAAVLAFPPAAPRALDLERVLCTCHDQATGPGDVQSCLALLTSRLVANGELTRLERAMLLRHPPLPPADCPSASGGQLDDLRYGLSVHVDQAFTSPGADVEAVMSVWNHSDEPAVLTFNQGGGRGCDWNLLVRDADGLVRHQFVPFACTDPVFDVVIAPGETWTQAVTLAMTALASEAGEPDGTLLPPGFYHAEAYLSDASAPGWAAHVARIPLQVE